VFLAARGQAEDVETPSPSSMAQRGSHGHTHYVSQDRDWQGLSSTAEAGKQGASHQLAHLLDEGVGLTWTPGLPCPLVSGLTL
jgi:hypothetical protein